ncbi:MAG: hypothetical protein WCD89_26365 [Anaerocolumna sp.]
MTVKVTVFPALGLLGVQDTVPIKLELNTGFTVRVLEAVKLLLEI